MNVYCYAMSLRGHHSDTQVDKLYSFSRGIAQVYPAAILSPDLSQTTNSLLFCLNFACLLTLMESFLN